MVLVFDLNCTLLDTSALTEPLGRIFKRKLSAQGYFDQVLKYCMAVTLAGRSLNFGEVAAAVLDMEAAAYGIMPSGKEKALVLNRLRHLPPFPDVKPALERLANAAQRMAVLTNSGAEALQDRLHSAGLKPYFEKALSVEAVGKFKPAPEVYRYAAQALGVMPSEILLVSAHAWDLLGAAAQGFQTALLMRQSHAAFPASASRPDHTAADLGQLVDQLLGIAPEPPPSTPVPTNFPLVGSFAIALGIGAVLWPKLTERSPS